MANRYPLVANASTLTIQELPSNDTLLVDNLTSTGNLSVAGNSNLGLVSTVIITGGTNGQYLQTDGSGNLSWTTLTVNTDSISNGNSNVAVSSSGGNVGISVAGNANVVTVTGSNVFATANIIPTANLTYSLGNNTNRWNNLYLSGNTIVLGDATITTTGNAIVMTNPDGGNFTIAGNTDASTSDLSNGTSNVNIPVANGNVLISSNGVSNVMVVTGTGANITGTLNVSGNANAAALGVSGNVQAAYFIGNGSQLTGIDATAIQNGNANVKTYANGNVAISAAGSSNIVVVTSTGANISGYANITGNANVGNLGATGVVATTLGGSLTTASQPNITSVGTLSGLTVSGNITPTANVTYDLGNSTHRFKDLYLSNSTIYLGNTTLSATGDDFTITGNLTASNGNLGNAMVANYVTGTLMTNAQPHVTSVGTLTGLALSGNATSTANIYANSGTIGASLLTGTLTTNAQPNITSVGTLESLNITNNLSVGGNFTVTGNLVYANVSDLVVNDPLIYLASNNVGDTDDIGLVGNYNDGVYAHTGIARDHTDNTWKFYYGVVAEPTTTIDWANASYSPVKMGSLTVLANANVGNIGGTAGVFTGNVDANYVIAKQITSNVTIGTAPFVVSSQTVVANLNANLLNGYAQDSSASANTLVLRNSDGNITANNITGTIATASQTNITTVGTLGSLAVTGNITSGNVYANSGTIGGSLVAGTLTTAAQPNVTSVGTLSSLGVSGTITAANITANTGVFTGNGASLTNLNGSNISSGTIDQARLANSSITVNGTSISLGGSATVTASTTNSITFNNGGAGGASGQTFNGGSAVTVSYNTIGAPSTTGTNASGSWGISVTGSAATAGTVTTAAQPNITSVGTLTSLAVTGNITAGNLTCSSGTVTAATLTETSSITIKENFRPIENPLDVIMQLVGHIYDRKDGTTKGEAGLVAEEVAQILPNLVGLDSKGNPDSVKYSRLTVYLLESIKVLKDEIDSLKGKKRKTKK
jgi:hypothetical protein